MGIEMVGINHYTYFLCNVIFHVMLINLIYQNYVMM
jgi:hypothetical protein